MLTNPVVLSIITMMVLCLLRFNVMLAILISAIVATLSSSLEVSVALSKFIQGMGGNLETALSYVLLGVIAGAVSYTNLTGILVNKVAKIITNKKYILIISIAFFSCFSQNLIPIHIAFIPILIPPLLGIMNSMKIDRRAVASALTFGLQTPYISLPVGFGLLFFGLIKKELENNGIVVSIEQVSSTMIFTAIPMIIGLALAIFVFRKPREYSQIQSNLEPNLDNLKMGLKEWSVLAGIVVAFVVQLLFKSLPLGALLGIITMVATGGINYKKMDQTFNKGMSMMGFIAFVMLVAAGFGTILRETGGVSELVSFASNLAGGKFGGAVLMLVIGLLVTMGIGTSFGTISIIAAIYCPLSLELGFSTEAIILLVGIAAAVGDAGSPASDSTLGPTSGLNADGNHNHIYDTCVPTFIFFNIPLIIFGVLVSLFI